MHLKSYPKLVRSELRLDAVCVQTLAQQSGLFVSQQGGQRRTCGSNHGNVSGSRLPFSVISTNRLRCSNAPPLCLKGTAGSALQLLPPPPGYENNTLRLYQTAAEDADAHQDIWTVIKPGHVREKIAIFASDGGQNNVVTDSERTSSSGGRDRTPAVCTNSGAMAGLLRAVKAKGSWEENGSAKRRRRSGSSQHLQQDQRTHSPSPLRLSQCGGGGGEAVTAEEEQKVSVVEMVAFLEQRATEQQPDSKPLLALQRSSTTITLSRAPPTEVRREEPDSVKVSDMVAKLESECLRRRRTEGDLSRSNSLRRTVGRVLLATGDQVSTPCQPLSPSSVMSSVSQSVASPLTTPPSPGLTTPPSGEAAVSRLETASRRPRSEDAEPLPGLLFLSPAASETLPLIDSTPPSTDAEPCSPLDSGSQSERRSRADRCQEAGRRASVSQDFLEMRQRLQQLLEPQPYLSVLPHHLMVKIFLLLPTQSLAALKCTCHYFKFIIDTYGVRPSNSLWVSDPRYRDDPCKQCKKRYVRGDVSLCRWHHKPFCQALPYGPGYWMCCHGAHRDAPGCNVGLHDNRWVPAFHSINVPIYRSRQHDA